MTRASSKTVAACAATLALLVLAAASVTAGPGAPPALTYRGGGQGAVIFDHAAHAAGGFVCADCHTDYKGTGKQLFQTQKQGLIDQATHEQGTSCFACHNDAVAPKTCETCHRG